MCAKENLGIIEIELKYDKLFAQVWNPLHEPYELREYPKIVNELDVGKIKSKL